MKLRKALKAANATGGVVRSNKVPRFWAIGSKIWQRNLSARATKTPRVGQAMGKAQPWMVGGSIGLPPKRKIKRYTRAK